MKTFTSHLLWACWLLTATTQAQYQLQGSVRDEANQAVPFSNVLLLNAKDSSLVKGSVAGETGMFSFKNLKAGNFLLSASMVGYQKNYSPIFETTELVKQPFILILKQESGKLNEVLIIAQKPLFEQQVDKLVVNVASSITAAGGTALEVLERSPGISINRQNNVLNMGGKAGVVVMLNGKMTRLPMDEVIRLLEGMSANNIEKIELITTPPARYDAEGDAGIINIITKKSLNYGTSGSFSGTLGYGWYARPAASLSLNHRNEKLNLFGDYAYSREHHWEQLASKHVIQQKTGMEDTGHISNRNAVDANNNAKAGFDYSFSKNTTLNGLVSAFSNAFSMHTPNVSTTLMNNVPTSQSLLNMHEINHWQHLMFNMALKHIFKNKREWSVDIDRLFYRNNQLVSYNISIKDFQKNSIEQQQLQVNKNTLIKFWVLKSDFVQPIAKKGQIEFGLKASWCDLTNDVLMERNEQNKWEIDPGFTQNYHLAENIKAAYTTLSYPINDRTGLQAGFRYEYTQTDINTLSGESLVHRQYGSLFPSVFLSHQLSKNQVLNLSYSRRITRPSYRDLAPFVFFGDLHTYVYGNERLLPTISDAVQMGYTLKDTYIFSVRYSYDKNAIMKFVPHSDFANNRINYYPENINELHTISLNTSLPIKFTNWWQSQNNMTGYWQQLQTVFQDTPINNTIWSGQFNSSHTFKLPHKFTAEFTYFYNSPTLNGVALIKSQSQVTLGLQKILPDNKGTLRLNITDIFWTNYTRWKTTIPNLNLDVIGHYKFEPRTLRLTYTRSIGNQKMKSTKNRTTGSEEERQRL